VEDAFEWNRVDAPEGPGTSIEAQIMEAFLAQHYIDIPLPATLILSEPVSEELLAGLSEQTGVKVNAVSQPREQRRAWLEMAQTNAALQLARLLAEEGRNKHAPAH